MIYCLITTIALLLILVVIFLGFKYKELSKRLGISVLIPTSLFFIVILISSSIFYLTNSSSSIESFYHLILTFILPILLILAFYGLESLRQGKEQLEKQKDEFIKKTIDERFFKLLDLYTNKNNENDKINYLNTIIEFLLYIKEQHKQNYNEYTKIPLLILNNLIVNDINNIKTHHLYDKKFTFNKNNEIELL